MAEKRNLNKVEKRLEYYVSWEQQEAERMLEMAREFSYPEEQIQVMQDFVNQNFREKPGYLAALYGAYRQMQQEIPVKEQTGERYGRLRYARYVDVVKGNSFSEDNLLLGTEYMQREAVLVYASCPTERGETFSDFFNADMFRKDWGEDVRYCAPWKKWLLWDGKRWNIDEKGAIYEMGEKTVRKFFEKAPRQCRTTDEVMTMMAHARRSSTAHKIESMLTTTRWHHRVSILPDEMDRDQFLLNCENGVIDLHCGRLYPHLRERMITKVSPVVFDEEADCPTWKKFLKDIFDNNRELIKFVQRFLGCCLTGDMSAQSMFILYGNGANGKSTFINVVNKIMGDYATTTPTETFMQKKGEQASNDIARLKGARFVTAMESDEHGRLAESIIKRLTGNDVISARFLYGEYFEFIPTFKIVMATNHKPRVSGMDYAIWRRIKLIPFEQTFPVEKQDKRLPEKLERELPGILKWMVEGCIKWQRDGLGDAEAVSAATDEYKNQMSDIQMFLSDCCTMEEEGMVRACDIYSAYKNWCEENNERAKSNRNFGMLLVEAGLDKVRLSQGIFYLGLKLEVPVE